MSVCEVQCPKPGSSAYVETELRVFDRSLVEVALECKVEAMAHQIQPILLFLIIREDVGPFSMNMVASAVLEFAFPDRRCHRCGKISEKRVGLIG